MYRSMTYFKNVKKNSQKKNLPEKCKQRKSSTLDEHLTYLNEGSQVHPTL